MQEADASLTPPNIVSKPQAPVLVARFIAFIVEANNIYHMLARNIPYIIHTSAADQKNQLACKLFLPLALHDSLTRDPYIWESVGVSFHPAGPTPSEARFSIGAATVVALIPVSVVDMLLLIEAGKPLLLSEDRMKRFTTTLQHSKRLGFKMYLPCVLQCYYCSVDRLSLTN